MCFCTQAQTSSSAQMHCTNTTTTQSLSRIGVGVSTTTETTKTFFSCGGCRRSLLCIFVFVWGRVTMAILLSAAAHQIKSPLPLFALVTCARTRPGRRLRRRPAANNPRQTTPPKKRSPPQLMRIKVNSPGCASHRNRAAPAPVRAKLF